MKIRGNWCADFKIYKFAGLFFLLVFLTSCDTGWSSKGVVIDKSTGHPIENAKIDVKGLGSTYTNEVGQYKIDTMIHGLAGQLEILVEKEGYRSKHVNFKTDKIDRKNARIEMDKLETATEEFCSNRKWVSRFYYFNLYFLSLLNVLTIVFLIFKKKIKWRALWILGILLFNFTLFLSFTDCSIVGFRIINGPIFLTHFWVYPYSVKIVVPLVTLLFWGIYLPKRNGLLKIIN